MIGVYHYSVVIGLYLNKQIHYNSLFMMLASKTNLRIVDFGRPRHTLAGFELQLSVRQVLRPVVAQTLLTKLMKAACKSLDEDSVIKGSS